MPLDSRKIHQYTEADTAPTFSELLNKLAESTSAATMYFSGTPAQRAAFTPAPNGATWQDTDTAGRVWLGKGGAWVSATGHAVSAYGPTVPATQDPSSLQVRTGTASGTTSGGGVLRHTLAYPFPNACVAVIFMPNQNKTAPVLVEADVTATRFDMFYSGAGNAQRAIQFIAFGY